METKGKDVIFINQRNPELSFSLSIPQHELIDLTLKDLVQKANSKYLSMYPQAFFWISSLSSKTIEKKWDQLFLNSIFIFKPFHFKANSEDFKTRKQIFIRTLTGQSKEIRIEVDNTIEQLKGMNEDIFGFPVDQQRLVFNGKQLEDGRKISDYNFQKECTIHMLLRMRGGGCTEGRDFVDLENKESQKTVQFSKKAPDYRVAKSGLNIEGYCQNKECPYFDKLVISPQQFGYIDIINDHYDEVKCPHQSCQKSIKIVTCGFTACLFKWYGIKRVDGKNITVQGNEQQANNEYIRFDQNKADGTSNIVKWKLLFISARPIQNNNCFICGECIPQEKIISYEVCQDKKSHTMHIECKNSIEHSSIPIPSNHCHFCYLST